MTTDEHAHVQHLEGLVKRFRSRIAAIDMENKSLEARAAEAERRLREIRQTLEHWNERGWTEHGETPLDDYGKEVIREVLVLLDTGAGK